MAAVAGLTALDMIPGYAVIFDRSSSRSQPEQVGIRARFSLDARRKQMIEMPFDK